MNRATSQPRDRERSRNDPVRTRSNISQCGKPAGEAMPRSLTRAGNAEFRSNVALIELGKASRNAWLAILLSRKAEGLTHAGLCCSKLRTEAENILWPWHDFLKPFPATGRGVHGGGDGLCHLSRRTSGQAFAAAFERHRCHRSLDGSGRTVFGTPAGKAGHGQKRTPEVGGASGVG